jgi:prolyl-tRNA synthetase
MTHGDDAGLRLPPKVAPVQVIVVIVKSDPDVSAAAENLGRELAQAGVRVRIDDRTDLGLGRRLTDWELKGVPVRVEIGPRDVEKGTAAVARRDVPGKEGKSFVPQAGLAEHVAALLDDIQQSLYQRALKQREERTRDVATYDELKEAIETGFARAYWAGSTEDEKRVQDETRATIRVISFDPPTTPGRCVYTGQEATQQVIFARAY